MAWARRSGCVYGQVGIVAAGRQQQRQHRAGDGGAHRDDELADHPANLAAARSCTWERRQAQPSARSDWWSFQILVMWLILPPSKAIT